MFLRDELALQASGVVGENNTYGEEVTYSGIWENVSFSLGQFHYETDGFRSNNDLSQDVYNAFVQTSVTPQLSVQVEARHRESERGDLRFSFDLSEFNNDLRRMLDIETVRAGANYLIRPNLNVIGSMIYLHEFQLDNDFKAVNEGYLGEIQAIATTDLLSVVAGGGYYDATLISDLPDPKIGSNHGNGYFYGHLRYPTNYDWTVGVSFDSLHDDDLGTIERVNPKFGLQWQVTPTTTIRGAVFHTLRRPLLTNQTIEPTQVAGFNQFFDDFAGTDALRYGIAVDQRLGSNAFFGLEVSERQLSQPVMSAAPVELEEDLFRAYVHWAPLSTAFSSARYELELFEVNDTFETRTHLVPMGFRYFHPSGMIVQVDGTYVDQSVNNQGDDKFYLVDTEIGYRLPKRYGIIRLGVRNLFDTDFKYQGNDPRTATIGDSPPFLPERTFLAQFTFAF